MLQKTIFLCLLVFALQSCKKENQMEEDAIGVGCMVFEDTTLIIGDTLVGTWNLLSTSGGFAGTGYEANFDKMTIDAAKNFELITGADLLANGSIEEIDHDFFDYYIRLNPGDVLNTTNYVDLIEDNEKAVEFEGPDTLHLRSDCCDRFDTHFIRAN